MVKKIKLVLGDLHVSRGRFLDDGSVNPLEDFIYDAEFVEFLQYYSNGEFKGTEVELILNGDFMNTLQVDVDDRDPTYITAEKSLKKMRDVLAGHRELFKALKEFAASSKHKITLVPGNHDPDFLWPQVRDEFARYLDAEINYPVLVYKFDGFHVEHGNQYSVMNAYEPGKYYLETGLPEPILNLPYGSIFIVEYLNKVKLKRSVVDKVRPLNSYLKWALFNDPLFGVWAIAKIVIFFLVTRFIPHPFRDRDFKRTLSILKEALTLIPDLLEPSRKILMTTDTHTVIMSHSHVPVHRVFRSDKEYFNTGTWNDVVSLDVRDLGVIKSLSFVLIEYPSDSRPKARLMEWKGIYRPVVDLRV